MGLPMLPAETLLPPAVRGLGGASAALIALAQRQLHGSAPARTLELSYDEVHPPAAAASGAASPPPLTAFVVHGLLGAGKNLRTFASDLCERAAAEGASWRAVLVDQRNHGRSGHRNFLPPHNLQSSARDLQHLVHSRFQHSAPDALIGHSMGGKVVLEYVRQLAAAPGVLALPKQVWVLDAKPGVVDAHSGTARDVGKVLRAVAEVPMPLPSRQALVEHLQGLGFSPGIIQWLGSNLRFEGKERYGWAFNVAGAQAMFDSYCRTDYFPLLRAPPAGVTINVVRAARSDRWDPHSLQAIQDAAAATAEPSPDRGTTRFLELPDAGHWVHVDNPAGLVEMVLPSLLEAAAK